MKSHIFFLFFLFSSTAFNQPVTRSFDISAQDSEQIFVQLNSTFLITGETLFFTVFCRQRESHKPTTLSKVAYLELIDTSGTPVLQTKVSLHEGSGAGDFFIPSTFSSGSYTLIAYTRWMKNFPTESFFANHLTIINPFRGPIDATANTVQKIEQENKPASSALADVGLTLNGKNFGMREKVTVTLAIADIANVCVSVRKKERTLDDSGSTFFTQHNVFSDRSASPFSSIPARTKTYLPEIRGHLIAGKLVKKDADTARRTTLFVSIPGHDFVFRVATTDQQGKFVMIVDRIPASSTMLYQVVDDDMNNYDLSVEDPFLGNYSGISQRPLSIDSGARSIIDERNVYTQIENAYYDALKDSSEESPAPNFYNTPDKIYKLDEFTRFPTLEDIFREYVPEVILKHLKGTYTLQVVNGDSGFPFPKQPLMLIDGVPIPDTGLFMAYDPVKVERMEIVSDKYFYGSLEFDGIISMLTYKGSSQVLPKFSVHREKIVGIQSGGSYSFRDYSSRKVELDRIPDYRLQLYWKPDVRVTPGQPVSIDFYTSDIPGEYEVLVEGFTDGGGMISARDIFSVLKK